MKTTVGSQVGFVFAKMATVAFLLGFTAFTSVYAQTEVPEAVQATFDEMFPDAEEVFWMSEGDEYVANFYHDEHSLEASILTSGEWVQTTTYLELEELPKEALGFINKEFGTLEEYYTITKVQTPELMFFTADFEVKGKSVYLKFDNTGKLLKKEVIPIG